MSGRLLGKNMVLLSVATKIRHSKIVRIDVDRMFYVMD